MKSLSLENDVYQSIMERVAQTGRSPSAVLRSKLGLHPPSAGRNDGTNGEGMDKASRELATFLAGRDLESHNTAVKRYLEILSVVYGQKEESFSQVAAKVKGSKRKYFGQDSASLTQSGSQVNPQPIPSSPYWAATNQSTAQKKDILGRVLRLLDYDAKVIRAAKNAL